MTDNTELLSDTENTNKELNEVFDLLASMLHRLKKKPQKN
jgi:ADP-dependent phosphofructokinase/glucokinase